MKRLFYLLALLSASVAAGVLATVGFAQAPVAKKPLYVFLYARVTDHVNLDISEDQLRRVLPTVERYRREHPDQHVTATVLFSGAASQALSDRNAQTHIVDFVRDYIKKGVILAGYDGTDEPTYSTRPTVDLTKDLTPQERQKKLISDEESFLTDGRDPLTGVAKPGASGGLKRMQEVFGEASCITGVGPLMLQGPGNYTPMSAPPAAVNALGLKLPPPPAATAPEVGGDTEAVLAARKLNSHAIMFGLPDVNVAHLPGFGGARSGFSKIMNPGPDTAPELYWQDYVLRSSETSGEEVSLVRASDGMAALQKVANKATRSSIRVVHLEIGSEQAYVKAEFAKGPEYPPLKYAYSHPGSPNLPAESVLSKSEVDAAYANQDGVLKWLTQEYLPANPGSGFVSGGDLLRMVEPSDGYAISMNGLRTAAAEYLKQWGSNTYGPSLFQVEGHYLSRAETFQVMTDALAELHRSGKLPQSVTVYQVFGPERILTGHGPNAGQLSVASVAKACASIAPSLHDLSGGSAAPINVVPVGITVDGVLLNPAQFLRLMASALQDPSPGNQLNVKMAYELTGLGELMPKSRPASDSGFIWTLKPVTVRTQALQAQLRP